MAVRESTSDENQQSAVVIVDNGGVEERVNLRVLSNKAIKALAKDSGLKVKSTRKQDMIDEIIDQAPGAKLTIQQEETENAEDASASQKNEENYAGVIITNKDGNEEEINLYSIDKQAVKKLAVDSGLQITKEDKDGMIQEIMEQVNEAYQETKEAPAENNNENESGNEMNNSSEESSAPTSTSFLSKAAHESLVRSITRTLAAEWKDDMHTKLREELKQQVKNDFMENSWDDLMKEIKADAAKNSRNGKKASSIKARADK
ncbi:hypothetical protein SAMN05421781_0865 [Marinococcus luteus]|uniref:Rho termination factor, N-terminal domain n=1 Tax=Marinococcus luteus TaxID=1122204 RepID=A0A1H2RS85_9BACI|nr:hypothetical protein [Marinococcus luteus]SDW21499.1 hypothetical protein SAMN05421781_0865 [Marinococcus luteus]